RKQSDAEREAEHCCTRKHNEHGRFISIISINNGGRSILVIPELALNVGWHDIAFKIESFIKCSKRMEVPGPPRITKSNYPYAKAVKDGKWQTETIQEAEITNNASIIEVLTHAEDQEIGLLERCLVGHLEGQMKEKPTLPEIRRWLSTLWKKAFGVDIYEMYGGMFLFEFPNINMAEQTLQGQWNWKNHRFNLEWWNPMVGCLPKNTLKMETWIRIVGIPLHLWSGRVFQEIENLCGGWVATEEETELRNHMNWARILVANDGINIPKEVSISRNRVILLKFFH
ncbi:hypothetical protein MTR67_012729, partial [Solanum verrucosum]